MLLFNTFCLSGLYCIVIEDQWMFKYNVKWYLKISFDNYKTITSVPGIIAMMYFSVFFCINFIAYFDSVVQ